MNEQSPKRIGPSGGGPTGRKKKPPAQSKIVQYTSTAFVAVAIAVWLAVAPRFFPRKPGEGINFNRILVAALVGGVAGGIGAGVGKAIEKLRV
jgi:RsiW-degrading membrane proteinase PrsW (M82 family)